MALKTARCWVTSSNRCYSLSGDMETPAVGIGGSIRNSSCPYFPAGFCGYFVSDFGLDICLPLVFNWTPHPEDATLHRLWGRICSRLLGDPCSSGFDAILFCLLSHWGALLISAGQMMPCCLLVTIYPFTCCLSALNKLHHSKLKA